MVGQYKFYYLQMVTTLHVSSPSSFFTLSSFCEKPCVPPAALTIKVCMLMVDTTFRPKSLPGFVQVFLCSCCSPAACGSWSFFHCDLLLLNVPSVSFLSVLVLVMGKEGVHGGGLNKKAYSMAKYLRDSGF